VGRYQCFGGKMPVFRVDMCRFKVKVPNGQSVSQSVSQSVCRGVQPTLLKAS
jgi:hypothetical protein